MSLCVPLFEQRRLCLSKFTKCEAGCALASSSGFVNITMNSGYRQQSSDGDRFKSNPSTVSVRTKLVLTSKTEKELPQVPPSQTWGTQTSSRGQSSPRKRVTFTFEEPPTGTSSEKGAHNNIQRLFPANPKSVQPLTSPSPRQRPMSYVEAAARKRSDTAVNTSSEVRAAFDPNASRSGSPTKQHRDLAGLRKTALTNAARETRPSTVAYLPRPKSYHSAVSCRSIDAPFAPRPRFAPGELINAAHVSVKDPRVRVGDTKSVTESNVGDVVGKYRYMIVLAIYQSHMLTLPIYTHGGFGLCNKPEWYCGHHMQFRRSGTRDEVKNYTDGVRLRVGY